jgi:type VI secretion system secreted protein Hcp
MANLFLKLDNIAGESTDDKHKGEIEIESFSWGLTQTGGAVGGGGGAGKAQFEDLTLVAATSSASPKLFVAAASGEHVKEANLTVRKAGEKPVEFYKIRLEDVLVSSFHTAGAEGEQRPVDQFSLNFAKIQVSYSPQNEDGSLGGTITGSWDVKKNARA